MAVGDQITKNSEWIYSSNNKQWYAKIAAKITEETATTATIEVGGWLYVGGIVSTALHDTAKITGQLFLDPVGGVANQVWDDGVKEIFFTSNSGWINSDTIPCIFGQWTITKNSSDEISVSPKFEITGLWQYDDIHFILTPDEVLSLNPVPTYTISYNTNEGIWRNEAPADQTKTHDISLTLTSIQPIRTGYNFIGWNTQPDGTGISYEVSGNYTENANATLYAQWQPESYVVSYDFNEGNSEVISNQSKYYDIPLVLTSKIPSKTGYIFTNWNTLQDGTGDVYLPNDIYNENEDITLYAQWREKSKGWINKIKLLTGSEDNRVENEFTLGATFDQVQYSENNAMTLLDFINIIKKFFKSKMFMHYCGQEPTDNVMEWYQVVATNANPTKDELNAILG